MTRVGCWFLLILGAFSPALRAMDDADEVARKIVGIAKDLRKQGQDDAADKMLRDAAAECEAQLRRQPNDALARFGLAQLQFELEQDDAAKTNLEQALAAQPNCAAMHAFQAYMLGSAEEYAAAETAYRKALALNPQDLDSLIALAGCLSKLRREDEAIAVAREAARMWPKDVNAVIAYAGLLNNAGKAEESESVLAAAVEANPKAIQLRECLAMMLFSHQRYRDAYAQRVEIAKLNPDIIDNEIKLLMFATSARMVVQVEHIDRLYELRRLGKYTKESFPRELFAADSKMVMSLEYFGWGNKEGVKYEFGVVDKEDKVERRIVVWTDEKVNEQLRSQGKLKDSERAYLLGAVRDKEQQQYGMYPSLPSYEQVRAAAVEIIEGKRQSKALNAKAEQVTPIMR